MRKATLALRVFLLCCGLEEFPRIRGDVLFELNGRE